MLTPEQIAIRQTGIGASEVAALLDLSPYQGPIDVWLRKPTPARPPLVDSTESAASEVGSVLEKSIVELYQRRTGRRVRRPQKTLRHRRHPHVLASPDGICVGERRGLEIKVVGHRMMHHWEGETVPDYYLVQAAQCMAVTGIPVWDVAALVGGTDLRIHTITRDPELEESLIDACETFWRDYIETNTPPPVTDPEQRRRYLQVRYPGSSKTACEQRDDEEVRAALKAWQEAKEAEREATEYVGSCASDLLELIGDGYGIEGEWGKFIAPTIPGKVNWRAIVDELGIVVTPELIEKHRGGSYRQPRFYPPKKGT